MYAIKVGNRLIGDGQPAFIAAEVGLNHNGDMNLAHRLIDAAADAGADAVKFQNYRVEDFLSDSSLRYEYVSHGQTISESQYEMFKRYELPRTCLSELRAHCDQRGIIFFSTPTGEQGVSDLVDSGATLLKNGSDYLMHLPLIQTMARTGLPTVISTGMAMLSEIDEAVRAFRDAGGEDIILLHCTSSYPTPADDVHLRKIPTLAAAFGCPIGLSDHTWGSVAAIGAVALGACFIEKHFTLDKGLLGPDHRFSADQAELRTLVDAVRTIERNLGGALIGPTPSEEVGRRNFRLSCVAARDLSAADHLIAADIAFRRPATGLPPQAIDWLIGRKLRHDVLAGKLITLGDFA